VFSAYFILVSCDPNTEAIDPLGGQEEVSSIQLGEIYYEVPSEET
jgi:hypothetical protein